jgi:preprotein translocase subunit SecA
VATPVERRPAWSVPDSIWQTYLRWAGIPVEYDIRGYLRAVEAIDAIPVAGLPEADLRSRAAAARARAQAGESADALLPEVFALVCELSSRLVGMRPFDIQVAAGLALHQGRLAQLATGEGKTLVAVMPATLNALAGRGVHVFTANDYLARRDAEWMGPIYQAFGLDVRFIVQGMTHQERRRAYAAHITYVTAKEAGFDFLRDHTSDDPSRVVQRPYHYVIVDEADFILIDEARVPLVIAGPAPPIEVDHPTLAALVLRLRPGRDYDADQYQRTIVLTEAGFERAGELLGGIDLHDPARHLLLSALHVALHAQTLLQRDRDYIVRDGAVELVDEFTGRVADNRRWPHGIQPAVEAKEALTVQPEGRILGSIPIQHFVRLYPKIAAMTATAVSAAQEFSTFFCLTTVVFPPNRASGRVDEDDVVFTHRAAKTAALVDEIARVHATGRPILVGTSSVRESEELAGVLTRRGVPCRVLNARQDAEEARIVAQAGTLGAVTISTNMAGRGTDIVLGGGDATMHAEVLALGGLYVVGTNRHESQRVDDQLRGRAGRQGDAGTSRFFISLEDDLIQRYGVMRLIPASHRPTPRDAPIDDAIVRREIARAQRIIEGQNFDIRKTLWRYSDMVDQQRRRVYERRQVYLRDEHDPGVCAEAAPEHYEALVRSAGADAVRRAEQRIMMHLLDRNWAEHLALIEDIREGIHLQRLGGKEPLTEFSRQIIEEFGEMMDRVDEEAVALFERLTSDGGTIDLARVGIGGSSSTWTYLVNDNPFSTLGQSLLASRTLTSVVGFLAIAYLPLTLATTIGVFLRRRRKRQQDEESAQG